MRVFIYGGGLRLEGSMSEAKRILKDTLTEMLEEGEI